MWYFILPPPAMIGGAAPDVVLPQGVACWDGRVGRLRLLRGFQTVLDDWRGHRRRVKQFRDVDYTSFQ